MQVVGASTLGVGSATFRSLQVRNTRGALYTEGPSVGEQTLTIWDSTFTNCATASTGGTVVAMRASLNMSKTVFGSCFGSANLSCAQLVVYGSYCYFDSCIVQNVWSSDSILQLFGSLVVSISSSKFFSLHVNAAKGSLYTSSSMNNESSNVLIKNSSFENCLTLPGGAAVFIANSSLYISLSIFSNCSADSKLSCSQINSNGLQVSIEQTIFSDIETNDEVIRLPVVSNVSVMFSRFLNVRVNNPGGLLHVGNLLSAVQFLNIFNSKFTGCSTIQGGASISANTRVLNVTGSNFSDCFADNYLSCSQIITNSTSVLILNSFFTAISSKTTVIRISGASYATIFSSNFEGLHVNDTSGGAIYAAGTPSKELMMSLSDSTFQNCSTASGGFALAAVAVSLNVSDSIFSNCSASSLGCSQLMVSGTSAQLFRSSWSFMDSEDPIVVLQASSASLGWIRFFTLRVSHTYGSLHAVGPTNGKQVMSISDSVFYACFTSSGGAAVSTIRTAVTLYRTSFQNCVSLSPLTQTSTSMMQTSMRSTFPSTQVQTTPIHSLTSTPVPTTSAQIADASSMWGTLSCGQLMTDASQLQIFNSTFVNIKSNGSLIWAMGPVIIVSSTFSSLVASNGILNAANGQQLFSILGSIFFNCSTTSGSASIVTNAASFSAVNTNFLNCTAVAPFSCAQLLLNSSAVLLVNISMMEIFSQDAVIQIYGAGNITVTFSQFLSLRVGESRGSIHIEQGSGQHQNFLISDSSFSDCFTAVGGATLTAAVSNITILRTSFTNCKASSSFTCSQAVLNCSQLNLGNSIFSNIDSFEPILQILEARAVYITACTFNMLRNFGIVGSLFVAGQKDTQSTLSIQDSTFVQCLTAGGGGAVLAITTNLALLRTNFSNCTSVNPLSCGQLVINSTSILISSSEFSNISSLDPVLQLNNASIVNVVSSLFSTLHVSNIGGSLHSVGPIGSEQTMSIFGSDFKDCMTAGGGASISAIRTSLSVTNTSFSNCSTRSTLSCSQIQINGSFLNLSGSSFLNIFSNDTIVQINGCKYASVRTCLFSSLTVTDIKGSLYVMGTPAQQAMLLIGYSTFLSCSTITGGSAVTALMVSLALDNSNFMNCAMSSMWSCGQIIVNGNSFSSSSSKFSNIVSNDAVVQAYGVSNTSVINSVFSHLSVNNLRGCLYSIGPLETENGLNIANSSFEACYAATGGAVIFANRTSLNLTNSSFLNCYSSLGSLSCGQIYINGSVVSISQSNFSYILSNDGLIQIGGAKSIAVSTSRYTALHIASTRGVVYASALGLLQKTAVNFYNSTFQNCSTAIGGAAISLLEFNTLLKVFDSSFLDCTSNVLSCSQIAVNGSELHLSNTTFTKIFSYSGIVQYADLSSLTVTACSFYDLSLSGAGSGSIQAMNNTNSVAITTISIADSVFRNCSSASNGATIISAYKPAVLSVQETTFYGCAAGFCSQIYLTTARVDFINVQFQNIISSTSVIQFSANASSIFSRCSFADIQIIGSNASSAIIFAAESFNNGSVTISNSTFTSCASSLSGGAIKTSGASIVLNVNEVIFSGCSGSRCTQLSIQDSTCSVTSCSFVNILSFSPVIQSFGVADIFVNNIIFSNVSCTSTLGCINSQGLFLKLSNNIFLQSSASNGGAIVFASNPLSTLTMSELKFSACRSAMGCTQVKFGGKSLKISSCSFINIQSPNSIIETYGQSKAELEGLLFQDLHVLLGGAINASGTAGSELLLSNSTFSNCSSSNGGAVLTSPPSQTYVKIMSCYITGCRMSQWGCTQIQFEGSQMYIFHSMIYDIETAKGVVETDGGAAVSVVNCSFLNLHVSGSGGALNLKGANSDLENLIFLNCTTDSFSTAGAAIYASNLLADLNISNCTFSACHAASLQCSQIYITVKSALFSDLMFFGIYLQSPLIQTVQTQAVMTKCRFEDITNTGNDGSVLNATNSHIFVQHTTFLNCNSSGNGGAISSYSDSILTSDLTFDDSEFVQCFSKSNGGAVYMNKGLIKFTNTNFSQCFAFESGGSIYLTEASLTMIKCQISDSFVKTGFGGAIRSADGVGLSLDSCFFETCTSLLGGGVLSFSTSSTLTDANTLSIQNSQFSKAFSGANGGIFEFNSTVVTITLSELLLHQGSSTQNGGAIYINGNSEIKILKSNISDCNSRGDGGSIYIYNDAKLIVNMSSISDSHSIEGLGGAISSSRGDDVTVYHTRFDNCTSSLGGGAICVVPFTDGISLNVTESSFHSCQSKGEGGSIVSAGIVFINVNECVFQNSQSVESGGAISVLGGQLYVVATQFVNCSTNQDGGALSGSYFGSFPVPTYAQIDVDSAIFTACSADGYGGDISAAGGQVDVRWSTFTLSKAKSSGGAVSVRQSANATLRSTLFSENTAVYLSSADGALGGGGGAIHVQNSSLLMQGLTCIGNSAPYAGGGILFWEGDYDPNLLEWCPVGSWSNMTISSSSVFSEPVQTLSPLYSNVLMLNASSSVSTYSNISSYGNCSGNISTALQFFESVANFAVQFSEPSGAVPYASSTLFSQRICKFPGCVPICSQCSEGKYQSGGGMTQISDCTPCKSGTFSSVPGSSSCETCIAGMYQPDSEQTSCLSCSAGTYQSAYSALSCKRCEPGKYQSRSSSTFCESCTIGKYLSQSGQVSESNCTPCSPGSFQSNSSSSACVACFSGKYENQTGMTNCSSCPPGKYLTSRGEINEFSCISCESGSYVDTFGSSACSLCGAGKFQTALSITSSSQCESCVAGTYQSGSGVSQCTLCQPGTYQQFLGQKSSGNCSLCSQGTYQSGFGMINITECYSCSAGTYQTGSGMSVCSPCEFGTFLTGTGMTSKGNCSLCPAGTFQSGSGMTTLSKCTLCNAGTYQTGFGYTNILACSLCSPGTYQSVTGISSSSQCIQCGKGTYQSGSGLSTSSNCSTCSPGTYQSESGKSRFMDCLLCAAGTFQSKFAATSSVDCIGCGVGTFSSEQGSTSSGVCTACGPGTFQSGLGMTNTGDCQQCSPGLYQSGFGVDEYGCTSCGPGTYQTGSGIENSNNCTLCDPGTYQSGLALTAVLDCVFCESGKYQTASGSQSCSTCDAGKYLTGSGFVANNCSSCAPGTYQNASASSNCKQCSQGKYQSGSGMMSTSSCFPCQPGTFQSGLGTANCSLCMPGYYSIADTSACSSCVPGKYSTAWGGENSYVCQFCDFGQYTKNSSSTFCLNCTSGSYSSQNFSSCLLCPVGKFGSPNILFFETCNECTEGQYQSISGQSMCDFCTSGKYQTGTGIGTESACLLCPAGSYAGIGAANCTLCDVGKYSSIVGALSSSVCKVCYGNTSAMRAICSNFTVCEAGMWLSNQTGLSTCQKCPAGTFQTGEGMLELSDCILCSPGKYISDEGSTSCSNCIVGTYSTCYGSPSSFSCIQCKVGKYSSINAAPHACNNCSAGYFAEFEGSSVCSGCPAGSFSTSLGADNVSSCSGCIAGKFSSLNSSTFCWECDNGTYQSAGGQSFCLSCGYGTYQTGKGMVSDLNCTTCDAGKYQSKVASVQEADCLLCSSGTYQTGLGMSDCTFCIPGKYQSGIEAIECALCSLGSFQTGFGSSFCILCPAGTYQSAMGSRNSTESCLNCAAGKYASNSGFSECVLCETGTYSSSMGLTNVCVSCGPGKYQTGYGMPSEENCTLCSAGSFQSKSSAISPNNCTYFCPPGTYQTKLGLTSTEPCLNCPLGKYQTGIGMNSINECKYCSPGKYSDITGTVNCSFCYEGTYQTGSGMPELSNCTACNAGKFSSSVASNSSAMCIYCGSGKYSTTVGATTSWTCIDCDAGTYASGRGTDTVCNSCSAGKYQSGVGMISEQNCTLCLAGRYQTSEASVKEADCLLCTPGTYQTGAGMNSCTPCSSGNYQSGTQGVGCVPCRPGTYQTGLGNSICELCAAGTYQTLSGSKGECVLCAPGTYQSGSGMTSTDNCSSCIPGKFAAGNGTLECTKCSPGKYQSLYASTNESDCLYCPSGLVPNMDASACMYCSAGNYYNKNLTTCIACQPGAYQKSGVIYVTSCLVCASGKFQTGLGSTECTMCPAGTYQTGSGVTSSNQCSECGAGQYQTGQGMVCILSCKFCEVGTYQSAKGKESCIPCPAGSYQGQVGTLACIPCLIGSYQTGLGMVDSKSCVLCPPGTFQSALGASSCLACEPGTYQPIHGMPVCTRPIWGPNNSALFGANFSSSYKRLDIQGLPSPDQVAFPGITLPTINVSKRDAYEQIILSDQSSFIQAKTAINNISSIANSDISLTGTSLVNMVDGAAIFTGMQVTVTYKSVDVVAMKTHLKSIPIVYFEGVDLQTTYTTITMTSVKNEFYLAADLKVCPAGYILTLSSIDTRNGSASCTKCPATTTYSLFPLASLTLEDSNQRGACQTCPPGLTCFGNETVIFDEYPVTGAPNTTNTYSVRSNWTLFDKIFFQVVGCPYGYERCQGNNSCDDIPSMATQECTLCQPGYECNQIKNVQAADCVRCTKCNPGFYKETQSSNPCQQCPADTFNPKYGSSSLSDCSACPQNSGTYGKVGQTSVSACECTTSYYLVIDPSNTLYGLNASCDQCPAGAVCSGTTGDCLFNPNVNSTQCVTPTGGTWEPPFIVGQPYSGISARRTLINCAFGRQLIRNQQSSSYYFNDGAPGALESPMQYYPKESGQFDPANQECFVCAAAEYIVDQKEQCQQCPNGAKCSYGVLIGNNGSYWRREGDRYRVYKCDPGYIMVRNDKSPDQAVLDECIACLPGVYSLTGAAIKGSPNRCRLETPPFADVKSPWNCSPPVQQADVGGFFDPTINGTWVDDSSLAQELCATCPYGATCSGKTDVTPLEGFFVAQIEYPSEFKGRRDFTLDSNSSRGNIPQLALYPCPPGACLAGGTCAEGREGPVCGRCKAGYAMASGSCTACPTSKGAEDTEKSFAFGIGAVMYVLLLYVFSLRPIFVEDNFQDKLKKILARAISREMNNDGSDENESNNSDMVENTANGAGEDLAAYLTGYIKVLIGFLQIMSTFTVNYQIAWPDVFEDLMLKMSFFRFDLLSLPATNCISADLTYTTKLLTYTIAPLIVLASFGIAPTITARFYKRDSVEKDLKVKAQAFYNVLFFLFFVYPTVSLTVLNTFNCQAIGSDGAFIKVDYREPCPFYINLVTGQPDVAKAFTNPGFAFQWSLAFTFVYPFGIPVFFYLIMRHYKVPQLARKKLDKQRVTALIEKYRQCAMPLEIQLLVRQLWTDGMSPAVGEVRIEDLWEEMNNGMDDPTSDDKHLSFTELLGFFQKNKLKLGLPDPDENVLSSLFRAYDADRSGALDRNEFREMMKMAVHVYTLFTGHESVSDMSFEQLYRLQEFANSKKIYLEQNAEESLISMKDKGYRMKKSAGSLLSFDKVSQLIKVKPLTLDSIQNLDQKFENLQNLIQGSSQVRSQAEYVERIQNTFLSNQLPAVSNENAEQIIRAKTNSKISTSESLFTRYFQEIINDPDSDSNSKQKQNALEKKSDLLRTEILNTLCFMTLTDDCQTLITDILENLLEKMEKEKSDLVSNEENERNEKKAKKIPTPEQKYDLNSNYLMQTVLYIDSTFVSLFKISQRFAKTTLRLLRHIWQANKYRYVAVINGFSRVIHDRSSNISITGVHNPNLASQVYPATEVEMHKAHLFFEIMSRCELFDLKDHKYKKFCKIVDVMQVKNFLKTSLLTTAYQMVVKGEIAVPAAGWNLNMSDANSEYKTVYITNLGQLIEKKHLLLVLGKEDQLEYLDDKETRPKPDHPVESIFLCKTANSCSAFLNFKEADMANFFVGSLHNKDLYRISDSASNNLKILAEHTTGGKLFCFGIEPSKLSKVCLEFHYKNKDNLHQKVEKALIVALTINEETPRPEIAGIDIFEDQMNSSTQRCVAIVSFMHAKDAKSLTITAIKKRVIDEFEQKDIVIKGGDNSGIVIKRISDSRIRTHLIISNLPESFFKTDKNDENDRLSALQHRFELIRRIQEEEYKELETKQKNDAGDIEADDKDEFASSNFVQKVEIKGSSAHLIFKDYLLAKAAAVLLDKTTAFNEYEYKSEGFKSKSPIKCHRVDNPLTPVELEQQAVSRVGFLMKNYQVQHWYFELLEMSRKLLMTSIVTFVSPGTPTQVNMKSLFERWFDFCS